MEVQKKELATVIILCPDNTCEDRVIVKVREKEWLKMYIDRKVSDFIGIARDKWTNGFSFVESDGITIIKNISDPKEFFEIRLIENYDFWVEGAVEQLY